MTLKMSVDKVHLRHVMLYEFWKEINVAVAVEKIKNIYQYQAPTKQTVEKWFSKFQCRVFNLEDELHSR